MDISIDTILRILIPMLIFAISNYIDLSEPEAEFNYSSVSYSHQEPVRDFLDREVRVGVKYYIIPVLFVRGAFGGCALTLGQQMNGTRCPSQVVEVPVDTMRGLPMTFTHVYGNGRVIRLSTDLSIEVSAKSACKKSSSMVWRLADYVEPEGRWFVEMGGVKGNLGTNQTIRTWFKIEKFVYGGDGYRSGHKLVYCPDVCETCKTVCMDVGVYSGVDGVRRLALVDNYQVKPLRVAFLPSDLL
ncbi:hypothetical protein MKW94_017540 [Papaver nudicaule]|uniref:Miraculin n=1 Tax=Papaver nudicaule TaxID=74823 RepID=A0AA41W0B8_PAPNU|nr:hypothetical protein [Papaver nudicaule]